MSGGWDNLTWCNIYTWSVIGTAGSIQNSENGPKWLWYEICIFFHRGTSLPLRMKDGGLENSTALDRPGFFFYIRRQMGPGLTGDNFKGKVFHNKLPEAELNRQGTSEE